MMKSVNYSEISATDKFNEDHEASDYIVDFYLKNYRVMVETTMIRAHGVGQHRKALHEKLVHAMKTQFGIDCDMNKIKYHFDYRKGKVMQKGHQLIQRQRSGEIVNKEELFPNMLDLRMWEFLAKCKGDESMYDLRQDVINESRLQGKSELNLDSLLKNNGVVLGTRNPKVLLNKESLKWDNHNTKLVLTNEASDFVVNFFLDHRVLLENTSSRLNSKNLERKVKMNELITHMQQKFDTVTDTHKLKTHFDNKKTRVNRKAFDLHKLIKEGKVKSATVEEMFDTDVELRLWRHIKDSRSSKGNTTPEITTDYMTKEIKAEIEDPELGDDGPLTAPEEMEMPFLLPSSYSPEYSNGMNRKRRYPEEEEVEEEMYGGSRFISDEQLRTKQFELMEQQIQFMEENRKLVTAMTTAVSVLFEKIEALKVPTG